MQSYFGGKIFESFCFFFFFLSAIFLVRIYFLFLYVQFSCTHRNTHTHTKSICSYENSLLFYHYVSDDQMFPIGISFFFLSFIILLSHTHIHTNTHTYEHTHAGIRHVYQGLTPGLWNIYNMVMHNLLTKESTVLRESRMSMFVFGVGCACVCGMQDTDSVWGGWGWLTTGYV